MTMLLRPEQRWTCPNCTATAVTHLPPDAVASQFHACRGLKGITAPMVPAGTKAKVEALEREDYLNGDLVTRDGEGRPVMAVETTRDDGNDRAVFAPVAVAGGRAEEITCD
jgi:hypothetical protein